MTGDSETLRRPWLESSPPSKPVPRWQVLASLLCFVLPLCLIPFLRASDGPMRWERMWGWPGDGRVYRLVVGEGDEGPIIYAAGAVGGLYVSADSGESWRRSQVRVTGPSLGAMRILDLAVDPTNPNRVHVVLFSRADRPRPMLYTSEDAGMSWRAQGALGPRRIQAIRYGASGDDLYLATGGEVVRALIRDGDALRFVSDGRELQAATIGALEPTALVTALAVGEGHVAQGAQRLPMVYVGTRGRGLWVFVDRADEGPKPSGAAGDRLAGWARGLGLADDPVSLSVRSLVTINALSVDPHRAGTVFAGTAQGFYVSHDSGRSWTPLTYPSQHPVISLCGEADGGHLFAGLAGGGALHSADDGLTWASLGVGLEALSVDSLAVTAARPHTLYAGTDRGLWRLSLDGASR